jgi:hypothetical protein
VVVLQIRNIPGFTSASQSTNFTFDQKSIVARKTHFRREIADVQDDLSNGPHGLEAGLIADGT